MHAQRAPLGDCSSTTRMVGGALCRAPVASGGGGGGEGGALGSGGGGTLRRMHCQPMQMRGGAQLRFGGWRVGVCVGVWG